tara:strand:- start:160 stop:333 length:174 start_codon:yes stop_codon:yes gene_type:complete
VKNKDLVYGLILVRHKERVRRIELPSSAWKAEVLAVELHPQTPNSTRTLAKIQYPEN